jgi:hypothetical protein
MCAQSCTVLCIHTPFRVAELHLNNIREEDINAWRSWKWIPSTKAHGHIVAQLDSLVTACRQTPSAAVAAAAASFPSRTAIEGEMSKNGSADQLDWIGWRHSQHPCAEIERDAGSWAMQIRLNITFEKPLAAINGQSKALLISSLFFLITFFLFLFSTFHIVVVVVIDWFRYFEREWQRLFDK